MTDNNQQLVRRASRVALVVCVVVLGAKVVAWYSTDSQAILADAIESVVNVVASVMVCLAVWYAARPPDQEHPYGHGRIEFVMAAVEGGMLLIAGVLLVTHSASSFLQGAPKVENSELGLAIVLSAGLVNGVLAGYLLWVARRTGSAAINADGRHLLGDLITTVGVAASLVLVRLTGWNWLDGATAIVVGLFLAYLGGSVIWGSLGGLLDRQDARDASAVRAALDRHRGSKAELPRLCSYEKVRIRHDGMQHWIDMHIRVPGSMSVAESHAIASALEQEVVAAVGGQGKATAHIEPCEESDCPICSRG
ncbi:MAG: cation transporter [Phycisphaerales bacterium]|nr:cation transporter [Phycisphaerales bacterium]